MQTRSKSIKSGNKFQARYDNSRRGGFNGAVHTITSGKTNNPTNPLHIPEIADQIFHFLKLDDIKNCRLVCQKWNGLALKFQKKLSTVQLFDPERMEEFNNVFPNSGQDKIFNSFELGYQPRHRFTEWPLHQFKDFVQKQHQNLCEITLFGLFLARNKNQSSRIRQYDLSPLLPSTLRKLKIESKGTTMVISTSKLCNIRILELRRCILKIIPGTVLNTVEIELERVTFCQGRKEIEEFLINPLLNFDVLKKARFKSENITLDLHGTRSLDVLSLHECTKVLNWNTSKWEMKKKLILDYQEDTTELGKNQMNYKELIIDLKELNVCFLPKSIEKLTVNYHGDSEDAPRIYGPHDFPNDLNFPNLKHLNIQLRLGSNFSPFVKHFKYCTNIIALGLSLRPHCFCCTSSSISILKTSAIPQSVKTLRVDKVRIIVDNRLQLETLFLQNYEFRNSRYKSIEKIAQELKVKKLCWLENGARNSDDINIFDKKREGIVKNLIQMNLDKFVVGYYNPNHPRFKKSFLSPLVKTQERCYLFQRGEKGKGINMTDAEELSKYLLDK